MGVVKKYITIIPKQYKDTFLQDICRENFYNTIIYAFIIILGETIIYIFLKDKIFNTGLIVIEFIIFNAAFLPVLWISYTKHYLFRIGVLQIILFIYFAGNLMFSCALSIVPQAELVTINPYIIGVFAIAAFINISPSMSLVLYLSVYTIFFFVLPFYQKNSEIATILQVNAFFMNALAWILNRAAFRMRVSSYIDKKIIEEQNDILKKIAIRDSMTLLLNHENLLKKLAEEIERSRRIQYPLSVLMLDIDYFKNINDRYGHLTGDKVIIKVAQILNDICRFSDIVGRYGGEEYLIITPDTGLKDAVILAERIRQKIQSAEFTQGICVTVSGGISEYKGGSVEDLIKNADTMLYKAKSNGRNRFEIASVN